MTRLEVHVRCIPVGRCHRMAGLARSWYLRENGLPTLMTVDQHELYVSSGEVDATFAGAARRFLRELAPQDFIVFFYLCLLNCAVFRSPAGAARNFGLASVSGLIVLHAVTMLAIRTRWFTHRFFMPLVYRLVT